MSKLIMLLGNGVTMDLFLHLDTRVEGIDLSNLFSTGDTVIWPDGSNERGFLSYKHCPSLWNLGARPNMDKAAANELIEEVITCANMISAVDEIPDDNNIYLSAYYELVSYLKHLFIQYDNQVSDRTLLSDELDNWGWLRLIKKAYEDKECESVIIITYNYDVFLERLLRLRHIPFSVGGLENTNEKIVMLKPHGSISFSHNQIGECSTFTIRKSKEMYEAALSDFSINYVDLNKNYLVNALIPPAGDSSRLTYKWANQLREIITDKTSQISDNDKFVISGISYWYVDRQEIDSLLARISKKNIETYLVHPHPPKALSAVLTCVLPKYITYSSSDWIGGILNG